MIASRRNIFVRSLGCKVNLADAAAMIEHLHEDQVRLVSAPDLADVVLLNTCTVTHKADRDVRKILGSLARSHPDLPVVVTGCGVKTCADRIRSFANVLTVIPPGDPEAVARALGADPVGPADLTPSSISPFARLGRRRAFAKVQDGCDARCTYCVVPRVRGPQRSTPVADAGRLVADLLRRGHREVVLTGIHLGRYGVDLTPAATLADLLQDLAPVFESRAEECRLRLSSIEPLEWTDRLISDIESHRFVCRHFHVPLQSGDDGVLARMCRPYSAGDYIRVVERLQRHFPWAALGADVLVGFPGESDRAARRTLELVRSSPLAYLHVFTFSARPGTEAAAMDERVPPEVVRDRAARLRRVGDEHWRRFVEAGRGKRHRVLVESVGESGPEGRSGTFRRIRLPGHDVDQGEIVEVRTDERKDDVLLARPPDIAGEDPCAPA